MTELPLPLTTLQAKMLDAFGSIYESHGLPRLKGLLVGLLLTRREPLSLDDMAALLDRSKGPISTTVRELVQMGLIQPAEGPVARRDYYVAVSDVFFVNFMFNMATVKRNLELAQTFLQELGPEPAPADQVTHQNLEHMRLFYELMFSYYKNFEQDWNRVREGMGKSKGTEKG